MAVLTVRRPRPGGEVRLAWLAVAAFPVALALVVLLGDTALAWLGYQPRDGGIPPPVRLLVGLPLTALAVTPGLLAWRLGTRARLAGDRRGWPPALLGQVLALGFVAANGITASIGW